MCVLVKARVDIRYLSAIIVHFFLLRRMLLWESIVSVFSVLVLESLHLM